MLNCLWVWGKTKTLFIMRSFTFLLMALLMSSALNAQVFYSEDFTNDPNYTSLSPEHAYWDETEGNYYVKTFDNLAYQYWAYSPQFSTVNAQSDLTVKLDMMCENADWGTYPGVHFYLNEPVEIGEESRTLSISFRWSDETYKKIRVSSIDYGYSSNESFEDNVWYSVTIDYHASENKADIQIRETATGATFYEVSDVDFVLNDFSYLGVGYYNQPNYGDEWSPIRIDNVSITGTNTYGTCYSEDFANNPNYTSLSPEHAYWDETEGNYYVKTFDNLAYQYWAYSPQFSTVNAQSDLTVKLDMMCENADWGTYPGVHFYLNEPVEIGEESRTLSISFRWSDETYKKIRVSSIDYSYSSNESFEDNVWYSVTIDYYASENKADIQIKETATGATFYEVSDVDFVLNDFAYLGVGYYNQPNYGNEWSPIRIDNIEISGNCEATGIFSSKAENYVFSIFPNPVDEKLTILSENQQNYFVKIYNSFGQQVFSLNNCKGYASFDMTNLPTGVYVLIIKDSFNQILQTQKIIKK
jgi:hypothetical protein